MKRLIHILKLGGSLLDLPDLMERLNVVRRVEVKDAAALVVGGGEAADVVRHFDRVCGIGEAPSHWLAVRAMQFNAHVIAAALPKASLAGDEKQCEAAWQGGEMAVIDPLVWLEREEREGATIPHRWTFTSDSIAAHVAMRLAARRLTLLKSTVNEKSTGNSENSTSVAPNDRFPAPEPRDGVAAAALEGLVDADFPIASRGVPAIDLINLRDSSLAEGRVSPAARRVLR